MNYIRLLKSLGIGTAALVVVTFLYANITNPIKEVITEKALDTALQEKKENQKSNLVVVEFYSPTCPVCIAFKKKGIFQETANELKDTNFVIVSSLIRLPEPIGDKKRLFEKYNVNAFPTFVFFKNGKEITRFSGYPENPTFTHRIQKIFDENQ